MPADMVEENSRESIEPARRGFPGLGSRSILDWRHGSTSLQGQPKNAALTLFSHVPSRIGLGTASLESGQAKAAPGAVAAPRP
jgi:hypothetical protein